MKKISLAKSLCALALAATTQTAMAGEPGKLHLTANLEGSSDTVIVITMNTKGSRAESIDTIVTKQGAFDTQIALKEVTYVAIAKIENQRTKGMIRVVAVPGEECHVKGSWGGEYTLSGSKFYNEFNTMDQALAPVTGEQRALLKECDKKIADGISRDEVVAYYQSKSKGIKERLTKAQTAFIEANPANEACATLLQELPVEQVHDMYNKLDEKIRNGRMAQMLKQTLAAADKELERQEQLKKVQPGNMAPDFTLNDINSQPLSLTSLRGKYVVLDFWGSWCGWCIKGMPEMKKYYEKYKDKMEILGIDCNDTEQKWKDAVAKHELPWKHVYNPRESDVCTQYAIQGYPTKLVVDPEGKIVKLVIGEDPAFYTFLDELFK